MHKLEWEHGEERGEVISSNLRRIKRTMESWLSDGADIAEHTFIIDGIPCEVENNEKVCRILWNKEPIKVWRGTDI